MSRRRVTRWLAGIAGLVIGAALLVPPPSALATPGTNDYPYRTENWCQTWPGMNNNPPTDPTPSNCTAQYADPWGFYKSECTSFVTWRMRNDNGYATFKNNMTGANGTAIHLGNAYEWKDAAVAGGFAYNATPARGSVAWWAGSYHGASSFGHVAWVETVSADGQTITVEEYNSQAHPNDHLYGKRSITLNGGYWPSGFIHFQDLPSASSTDPADMMEVKMNGTGSGQTEAHIAGRGYSPPYSSWSFHQATPEPQTYPSNVRYVMGHFDTDGKRDLFRIQMSGTASGKTEVHVLSGASNLTMYGPSNNWHFATAAGAVSPNDVAWVVVDPDQDGKTDLALINHTNGGSGKTEVHVLRAASNFADWGPTNNWHFVTPDSYRPNSDAQYVGGNFNKDGWSDIAVVLTNNTGSGKTEMHVFTGAANFTQWAAGMHHVVGNEGYSNPMYTQWVGVDSYADGWWDLAKVQLGSTGSGQTEIHTFQSNGGNGFPASGHVGYVVPEVQTDSDHVQWMLGI